MINKLFINEIGVLLHYCFYMAKSFDHLTKNRIYYIFDEYNEDDPNEDKVLELLDGLPEDQVNLTDANDNNSSFLIIAASWGHDRVVEKLLEYPNININYKDDEGFTALSCIPRGYSNVQSIKLLLEHWNIQVNERNNNGITALMDSVIFSDVEMIKLLLDHPLVSVNMQDYKGETALHHNNFNNTEVMKTLLKYPDIDVNIRSNLGNNVLHKIISCKIKKNNESDNENVYFVLNDNIKGVDNIKLLLDNSDIDINAQNNSNETALINAVKKNLNDIVKLLLSHPSININLSDIDGKIALDYAKENKNTEIINLLLEKIDL